MKRRKEFYRAHPTAGESGFITLSSANFHHKHIMKILLVYCQVLAPMKM